MQIFLAFSSGIAFGGLLILGLTIWSMNLVFIPEEIYGTDDMDA